MINRSIHRAAHGVTLLVAAALALSACGSEPADVAGDETVVEQSATGPDAPVGITVVDGRMTLPAVSGNPGAVYFTITNDGSGDLALAAASVADAEMAMLHQTLASNGETRMEHVDAVAVRAGETVEFAPGGLHVMAMEPSEDLSIGGTTEVTLTFTNGDKVSFPAEIVGPGGMAGDATSAAADEAN